MRARLSHLRAKANERADAAFRKGGKDTQDKGADWKKKATCYACGKTGHISTEFGTRNASSIATRSDLRASPRRI